MNKSTRSTNIFLKNYIKKLSKHTINLYLKYSKVNSNKFSRSINVNGKSRKQNNRIAEEFNKYFTNLGPNMGSKIENTSKTFEDFIFPVQKNMEYRDRNFEEFKKSFKLVKSNKAAGHDGIASSLIIKVYDEISYSSIVYDFPRFI